LPFARVTRSRCAEHAGQRAHDIGQVAYELHVLASIVTERGGGEFGHPRVLALARAGALRATHGTRPRRQVVHCARKQHRGLTVERGVVRLHVIADLPALQSVDHVHPPQRPAAIHQFGVQAPRAVLELRQRARRRQRHALHVIVKVDVIVTDPHGAGELQRHRRELALEDRYQMQALGQLSFDPCLKVAAVARRQVKQVQRSDVHRRRGCFQVQERAVDTAQGFHQPRLLRGSATSPLQPCSAWLSPGDLMLLALHAEGHEDDQAQELRTTSSVLCI
jgi:hypothetical protein